MYVDNNKGWMSNFLDDQQDSNEENNDEKESNKINMEVENAENESPPKKENKGEFLKKKTSREDDKTKEETHKSDEDDYFDNYEEEDGDRAEHLFDDFDLSSVKVNSELRTYQQENDLEEEEHLGNSFQIKMSVTEVTKYKTKK